MGTTVLKTSFSGTKKIRSYAHCAKQSKGITVLLINLDNSTVVLGEVTASNRIVSSDNQRHAIHNNNHNQRSSKVPRLLSSDASREEYHLTAPGGDLHSRTVLLNGKVLSVDSSSGEIPTLKPIYVNSSIPIVVRPYSIVFAHMPYFAAPACQ